MKDSLHYLLNIFLKRENIHLNQDELKLQLLSHPSYPSLNAIADVLDYFSINKKVLRLPKKRESLLQLPKHFIALVNSKDQKRLVLISQLDNTITIGYGDKKKESISIEVFLGIWNGIIVTIEKGDYKIPKNYNK